MAVNQQFSAPAHGLVNLDQYYPQVSLLLHMDGSNGGTTFTDSSLNPKTVTANGNTTTSTAVVKYGTASASFDGNGDYLSVPASEDFNFAANDFTMECFAYRTGVGTGDRFLISKNNGSDFLLRWAATIGPSLQFYINATQLINYPFQFTENNWYYIAVTKNGTTIRLFIDGVQVASSSSSLTMNNSSQPLFIGGYPGDSFQGYMDEVRITKGVARYTSNFNPPGAPFPDNSYSKFYSDPDYSSVSLLLHGDGSNGGTTFTDNSRFTRTPSAISNAVTSTTQKKFGVASIYMPAVTAGQLRYASSTDFNISGVNFTIEMWFYQTGGSNSLVCRRDTVGGGFTTGWALTTSSVRANINGVWSDTQITWSGPGLNTWNHIAWTVNGTTMSVYLNGTLVGTKTSVTTISDIATTLDFGQSSNGGENVYQGFIDDFRFTRGVARYTSNFTPPAAPHPNLGVQSNWIDNIYADQWYGNTVLLLHCDGAGSGTTFRDSSPQVNTVTANGNAITSTAATKWGPTSAAFDGNGDYLSTTYSTNYDFGSGDFTVEAWVYIAGNSPPDLDNSRSASIINSFGTSTIVGWHFVVIGNSTTTGTGIGFDYWNPSTTGAGTINRAAITINQNQWYHVAASRSSGTLRIFVNGSSITYTSTVVGAGYSQANASANGIKIGATINSSYPLPLNGYIDDLRITKGVARYTAAFTPAAAPFPNLAPPGYDPFYQRTSLLLHMDGANGGTTFTDNSPTPKAVTPVGNAATSTAVVKYGSASAVFDGNGDYLSTPDNNDFEFGAGDFTIESWIYVTSFSPSWNTIVGKWGDPSNRSWIVLVASSEVHIAFNNLAWTVTAPFSIILNTWYHVAAVRYGNIFTIYINGVNYGSVTNSSSIINGNTSVVIGANIDAVPVTWVHNGYIDELRITKGVARYTANFQPPTGPFPNR